MNLDFLSPETTHQWLGSKWRPAAPTLAGAGIRNTVLPTLVSQTSVVPWARVMASLHWAVPCYCRITERLIETNDSNNGTLSPQAGFVVGLISVVVVVRRTSHHADLSKEAAEAPFWVGSTGFSCLQRLRMSGFFKTSVVNVNISSLPWVTRLRGWVPLG